MYEIEIMNFLGILNTKKGYIKMSWLVKFNLDVIKRFLNSRIYRMAKLTIINNMVCFNIYYFKNVIIIQTQWQNLYEFSYKNFNFWTIYGWDIAPQSKVYFRGDIVFLVCED